MTQLHNAIGFQAGIANPSVSAQPGIGISSVRIDDAVDASVGVGVGIVAGGKDEDPCIPIR